MRFEKLSSPIWNVPRRIVKSIIRAPKHLYILRRKQRYSLPEISLEEIASPVVTTLPPILDKICLPPYLLPATHDDFLPLMRIAASLNAKTILELGTAHGNTVANLCNHLPQAVIYTVNAPAREQTGRLTTFELQPAEIGSIYRKYGFERNVVQILQNTLQLDLSRHLSSPVVDLAIIDACHDLRYVLNDFYKVRNYIRIGGMVLFHDTNPSLDGHLIESYRACMELRRRGFDIRHIEGTWWGVWKNEGLEKQEK